MSPFALWQKKKKSKEKQFSAAMISNDTQIVLSDEWSENTLQADLAKTVLQGGYMVTAVKHGEARTNINQCPFYITTNQVPKFGADDVCGKNVSSDPAHQCQT